MDKGSFYEILFRLKLIEQTGRLREGHEWQTDAKVAP